MIHKGIIRAYTPATHTASVQLTGSIAHYLTAIRVATNIPVAAIAAGRECTVLALDPNNPADALVLSIQGALPPAVGPVISDHAYLTSLAYADAAHTGFATSGHGHAHSALTALDYASAAHTGFATSGHGHTTPLAPRALALLIPGTVDTTADVSAKLPFPETTTSQSITEIYARSRTNPGSSMVVTVTVYNEAGTSQWSENVTISTSGYGVTTGLTRSATKNWYAQAAYASGGSAEDVIVELRYTAPTT